MINFVCNSAGLLPSDLNEIEKQYGFIFPQDVRRHYMLHNGGHPDKNRFSNESGNYIIDSFIPIKVSTLRTTPTLETILQWLRVERKFLPDQFIPFADDPCGNLYCFSVAEKDFGAIFWFEAERHERHRTNFLASSLDEFLSKLRKKGEV